MVIEQKKQQYGVRFLSVRFHGDSSIRCSVKYDLSVNRELSESTELTPRYVFGTSIPRVSKVWVN